MFHSFRGSHGAQTAVQLQLGASCPLLIQSLASIVFNLAACHIIYITTIMRAGEMILYFLLYLSSGDDR